MCETLQWNCHLAHLSGTRQNVSHTPVQLAAVRFACCSLVQVSQRYDGGIFLQTLVKRKFPLQQVRWWDKPTVRFIWFLELLVFFFFKYSITNGLNSFLFLFFFQPFFLILFFMLLHLTCPPSTLCPFVCPNWPKQWLQSDPHWHTPISFLGLSLIAKLQPQHVHWPVCGEAGMNGPLTCVITRPCAAMRALAVPLATSHTHHHIISMTHSVIDRGYVKAKGRADKKSVSALSVSGDTVSHWIPTLLTPHHSVHSDALWRKPILSWVQSKF